MWHQLVSHFSYALIVYWTTQLSQDSSFDQRICWRFFTLPT